MMRSAGSSPAPRRGFESHGETSPIKCYSTMTAEAKSAYSLDADGIARRMARSATIGRLGPDLCRPVHGSRRYVGAMPGGRLPGQRTRYLTFESSSVGSQPEHLGTRRTAPLAGSEAMLRQYIEAWAARTEHDRMTPEARR